jgi:hypothetical protein
VSEGGGSALKPLDSFLKMMKFEISAHQLTLSAVLLQWWLTHSNAAYVFSTT